MTPAAVAAGLISRKGPGRVFTFGGDAFVALKGSWNHPRRLLVLPNGDVIVAEQSKGYLTLLRDDDGDGKADWIQRHAEGFNAPYGLAWRNGVVLVADQDGIWQVPQGHYQNFVTGFWVSGQHRAEVWGRPAALAVTKDGALLIADDTGGTIWRISYSGPKQQTGQPASMTGNHPK